MEQIEREKQSIENQLNIIVEEENNIKMRLENNNNFLNSLINRKDDMQNFINNVIFLLILIISNVVKYKKIRQKKN